MEPDYKQLYEDMVQRCTELHSAGNALTKKQMEIVCPELARKEIIHTVTGNVLTYLTVEINKLLAWLEKQKEQEPLTDSVKFEEGFKLGREYERREQKKQKPSKWSNEDKGILIEAAEILQNNNYFILSKKLKSLLPQLKVEWSEEDEDYRQMIIRDLERILMKATVEQYKDFLNQEILWLKSLRPQPHWKPSEEQMSVLQDAVSEWEGYEGYKTLKSLFNDLKKL